MAKVILTDGQEFDYPDDIAGSDQMLRDALASIVPEIRNADIRRETKDGLMTVRIVKKAGTKGATPLDALRRARESFNPAIVLYREMQEVEAAGPLTVADLIRLTPRIEAEIEAGRREQNAVQAARRALAEAEARPAAAMPEGF